MSDSHAACNCFCDDDPDEDTTYHIVHMNPDSHHHLRIGDTEVYGEDVRGGVVSWTSASQHVERFMDEKQYGCRGRQHCPLTEEWVEVYCVRDDKVCCVRRLDFSCVRHGDQ